MTDTQALIARLRLAIRQQHSRRAFQWATRRIAALRAKSLDTVKDTP